MKKKVKVYKRKLVFVLIILLIALGLVIMGLLNNINKSKESVNAEDYNPEINPDEFTSSVTNKYFTLTQGKKMIYESKTEDGVERVEVYVTNEKKLVMGVETTVVWDRQFLNGELIEDTKDWYAQDQEGNVWYFGEDSKSIINNQVVSTKGSWEAGIDNAKPGIIMKANPQVGDSYRQEYYKGEAEDKADVLALNEKVSVLFGEFNDCIKTLDYTPLEPDVKENKYYCAEISNLVLEIDKGERVELISIEQNVDLPVQKLEEPKKELTQITEERAIQIALSRVPGKVTDVSIEKKFGRPAYVVEIDRDKGPETDVIIDLYTGFVLDIDP